MYLEGNVMTHRHEKWSLELCSYFCEAEHVTPNISANGMLHYRRHLPYLQNVSKIDRTWRGMAHHLRMLGYEPSGKSVLDLGCGSGYTSIYYAMAGSDRVVGLDLRESKIEAFQSYVGCLPQHLQQRIEVVKSSIEDVAYNDEFDLIYAQESISHIVDEELFARLYRMLKEGGVLLIRDGNNDMCFRYRKRLHQYWERVEKGPAGKCYPDDVEFVYRDIRKELINKWYQNALDRTTIEMLADNTSYLFGDKLRAACERYVRDGVMPSSPYVYATPPIHPEFGYYNERLFNPYHLRKRLLQIGFQECRLSVPSGHSRGMLTRLAFNALPLRLQYRIQPSFVVMAIK